MKSEKKWLRKPACNPPIPQEKAGFGTYRLRFHACIHIECFNRKSAMVLIYWPEGSFEAGSQDYMPASESKARNKI